GTLYISGATSTFTNGINALALNITGSTTSTFAGKISAAGGITAICSGACLDIAEEFIASETVEPGDLLELDTSTSSPAVVRKSTAKYSSQIIGVVSSEPGIILTGTETVIGITKVSAGERPPVALAGRVPLKVSTQNGPIAAGDELTASDIPGVAMKAKEPGRVIGTALESFGNGRSSGVSAEGGSASGGNGQVSGVIMVFVNPGWSFGELTADDIGNDDFPDFSLSGLLDKFTLAVKNSLRKLGLIVQNGIAKVKEVIAEKITSDEIQTKKLCIDDVCVTKDELRTLLERARVESAPTSAPSENISDNLPEISGNPTIPSEPDASSASGSPEVTNPETTPPAADSAPPDVAPDTSPSDNATQDEPPPGNPDQP
ncbi:MAG: hypothetical protein AAB731_01245, partial [Patescibacteria group bacterium]